MFCSNCGQRLADDAKHCPNCGALIRREDTAAPETEPRKEGTGAPEYDPYAYAYSYGESQTPNPAPAAGNSYGTPAPLTKADSSALTGLILAIISGVCCCVPFVGLPCAVLGIIFSAKGMKSESRSTMAVIGLILSIIFTCCNGVAVYSYVIALARADTWADMLDGAGYDFTFPYDFR